MEPNELLQAMGREMAMNYYNKATLEGIDSIIDMIRAEYKYIQVERDLLEREMIIDNEGIRYNRGKDWHRLSMLGYELKKKEEMIQQLAIFRREVEKYMQHLAESSEV